MRLLRNLSIKRKLMAIILLTSGAVLVVASVTFLLTDVYSFRRNMVNDLVTLAELIGNNTSAAL